MKLVKGIAILLFWSISTLTMTAANYQFDIGGLVFQEHFVALPVLEQDVITSDDWKLPERGIFGCAHSVTTD